MDSARLDEIERLAGAATQGKRVTFCDVPDPDGDMVAGICDCGFDSDRPREDAAFIAALDPDTVRELVRLARRAIKQRPEIDIMRRSLEEKNRALDALHLVWCSGGCAGGAHRYTDEPVTRQLVEAAEANTKRLREWYEGAIRRGHGKALP